MSETTEHTEEVVVEPQTVEALDDVEVIEPDNEPSEVEDQLDIDELISKPKSQLKTKEERQGLSRKEIATLKHENDEEDEQPDPILERMAQLEGEISELKANSGEVHELAKTTKNNQSESFIRNELDKKGVSNADFNKQYKSAFLKERDELVAEGMAMDKAVQRAMKYTLSEIKADKAIDETRAVGRKGAKMPAASTSSPTATSIKRSVLENMPVNTPDQKGKYNAIMDKIESGEMKMI